ncbi:MAG: cation diffusion facilitator family transporter [Allosphingosinicella sp.]|uniref:cation diffusion facilitator family transporter n=1 Tax=Allosphingosinicella sp. TaxID=2823234 RepID=UPI003956302C
MTYARDQQQSDAAGLYSRLTRRAALASVAMALFLLVLKAWAALETGSMAMLGSLTDTALDVIAAFVILLGVRLAALPADHDHRFGHGKAEALVALFQVGLITFSAVFILWRAGERLVAGAGPANAEYGIAVSIVSIVATFAVILYQRSVIRRTRSVAIRSNLLNYQNDLLLNLSVIVALALDQYAGLTGADALFGIAIALWIGWGAWKAAVHAVDQLMDKEWPEERRDRFVEIVSRHPSVRNLHDLRTRTSGAREFAQFHIWVPAAMTVAQGHDVMDEIEAALAEEFPGVEIFIHLDPEGQVDRPGDQLVETDLAAPYRKPR